MRWSKALIGLSFLSVLGGCGAESDNVAGLSPTFLSSSAAIVGDKTPTLIERPALTDLVVGSKLTLKANVKQATGNRRTISSAAVVWSSSNTSALTVSSAGEVTAVAVGSGFVRAVSGLLSDSVELQSIAAGAPPTTPTTPTLPPVPAPTPGSPLTIALGAEGLRATMAIGQSGQLVPSLPSSHGLIVATATGYKTWNESVIRVSPTGALTAVGTGTALVTAYNNLLVQGVTITVSLDGAAPPTITVTPAASSLMVGSTVQLSSATPNSTWTSSNTSVATVAQNGIVTAIAAGSAVVTARAGEITGQATITVTAPAAAPTPPPPTTPPGGGSLSFVQPTPPQKFVDVSYPAKTGVTRTVAAGQDLQAVLDAAQAGDEVVLAAGATFTGNFVLPVKAGSGWVVVRAATVPVAPGTRMTPQLAVSGNVAKVITPNAEAAIRTAPGAARWRLVGFEVAPTLNRGINYGLVVLGRGDETSVSQMPTNIVLDRMFLHGTVSDDLSRCVAFNGSSLAVVDSYLAECHGRGFDAQGICGWGGPGPFLIQNNWIEGSGQAIMFGGADPRVQGLSPADITIKGNYLYKPMSWAGGKWSVKATFEIKHGIRVLFEGNVLDNHWIDAQVGYAILFQNVADDGTAWNWVKTEDIMLRNNIIRNSTSGVNMMAKSTKPGFPQTTNGTRRVAFVNNLLINVGKDPINGQGGRIFQLLGELEDISIVNNTAVLNGQAAHAVSMDGDLPQQRLTFVNNVLSDSYWGIFGSGRGQGTAALQFFAPGYQFRGNVVPGQNGSAYPADNFFPALATSLLFAAPGSADYSLTSANPFYSGVFGRIGVNTAVLPALAAAPFLNASVRR